MASDAFNILQISPQVPFPLVDGGKVGIFNITKQLALRGHRITMVALDRSGVDAKPLEEFCKLLRVPHSNRNSLGKASLNLFAQLPYNIEKYQSKRFRDTLDSLLRSARFDVVHVDHLHMASYGIRCRERAQLPIVLREHNVESVIVERYARSVRIPGFRQWMEMQKRRIQRYEGQQASQYDMTCVITEEDKSRLLKLAPEAHVKVVPGGIDPSMFEIAEVRNRIPFSICIFGSFDWLPNRDALFWFVEEVFPLVLQEQPEAKLYVVGKDIPSRMKHSYHSAIIVKGFVQDLKREVRQYEVLAVPLRIGGGMRLKILESFAMRLPVVSTTIGAEGIDASHEEHLLIADTPELFKTEILRLFNDSALRERMIVNAYTLAEEKYRWEHVAEQLEQIYAEVIR